MCCTYCFRNLEEKNNRLLKIPQDCEVMTIRTMFSHATDSFWDINITIWLTEMNLEQRVFFPPTCKGTTYKLNLLSVVQNNGTGPSSFIACSLLVKLDLNFHCLWICNLLSYEFLKDERLVQRNKDDHVYSQGRSTIEVTNYIGQTRKNKFKHIDVIVSVGSVHLIHVKITYINFACVYILLN